ncbi:MULTISPECIES: VOC family protein [unclassified Paracoccus (in: a-proteobacteria)]|uniref:VOC family protein n=1 Tax=unclassified Paracoccus (in: a-proteobacteria) TaxID=2688777 RepID=UPI0019094FC2|nr:MULTISPECIES: VOC family protein [unclassified Paracoccus (in: a-proteobacteria)]QQO44651.1 VOC family protein [Paracoccus sp. MC1862]
MKFNRMMEITMRQAKPHAAPQGEPARAGITSGGSPLRIGTVALTVRDLDRVSRFYQDIIGLRLIEADARGHRLGAGDRVLLDLRHDPRAQLSDRHQAGLFHTAFLLPDRAALADWLIHAAGQRAALDGASDHLVSEALYLTDPEGNGIEIYRDRDSADWTIVPDGTVAMATLRLDLDDLAAAGTGKPFAGMPGGTIVGHVHLQVGDLDPAEAFYAGALGFEVMTRYNGANFFGSDGYHHHIGTNIWNSRGAGPRPEGNTGLAEVELLATPGVAAGIASRLGEADSGEIAARDPWGTRLTIRTV